MSNAVINSPLKAKKAALVTGGSRGIGRAISLGLAGTGIPVFVNFSKDVSAADETCKVIRSAGGIAEPIQADVSDREAVKTMFAEIRSQGFWVNTLVNNAGILRDRLCAVMSAKDWREVLGTNLDSAFYCIREALSPMITRRSGQIINVASVSGLRGQAGQANYSAAKAGLIALTRTLAREVGRYNIRVNAVAPGFIDTDMLRQIAADDRIRAMLEEVREKLIPLGRFGTAEEVAQCVIFLISPAASYLTGHVLVIDGGMTI